MTHIYIEAPNAKVVRIGLQKLSKDLPQIGRLPIFRTAQAIVRIMKKYPSQPSGSVYERTYTFRKSWIIKRTKQGYFISANPVSPYGILYGPFVVGDEQGRGQARVFKGRWPIFKTVAEKEASKLPPVLEKYIMIRAKTYNL